MRFDLRALCCALGLLASGAVGAQAAGDGPGAAGPASVSAFAPRIFACEPEWAALARILIPSARIDLATSVLQDPHHIEARPALIAQARHAEMAVCTGAGLEDGWLPLLQERSGNPRIQPGALGMVYAADVVTRIEHQAGSLNPFAGDVHPGGNPHVHTDPERLAQIVHGLSQRMSRVWPAQAETLRAREAAFQRRWAVRIQAWRLRAAPLQGRSVAAQHGSFVYLWKWVGVRQTVDLEPKPGLPPTPTHLQSIVQRWANEPPLAIVIAQHQDPRPARWLAAQAQPARRVVVLPATVPDPLASDAEEALGRWWSGLLEALLEQVSERRGSTSMADRPT